MKKIIASLLAASMIVTLVACGSSDNSGQTVTDGNFVAGKYTATADGFKGPVTVEVEVTSDEITAVNVVEHGETEGVSDGAILNVPNDIVKGQTLNVDTVSGATFTSNAIISATTEALEQAGANIDNLQTYYQNVSSIVLEDATYDVVIVGGGGAGLTAALEAQAQGSNVIIIEKMPFLGGNTLIAHGEMAMAENWIQDELGVEDSAKLFADDLYAAGDELADYDVVYAMAEYSADTALWLRDYANVEFTEGYLGQEGGHSVERQILPVGLGAGLVQSLEAKVREVGVTILTETTGDSLVQDETGRVIGVNISSGDQTAVISATNGVVLTTGGFGANVEMRVEYNTIWGSLGAEMPTSNAAGIMGDGITMASEIGADLMNMEQIQLYPFNNPVTGVFFAIEAPNWTNEGHMYINQNGERFVNEFSTRKYRAAEIIAQEGDFVYCIYNQEVADRLGLEGTYATTYATCEEQGVFYKADTLEEIAEYYGINAENLVASVDKYNDGIANNNDEFGREDGMVQMFEGPWFILQGSPTVHHTMGGVKIDADARVIDTDGNIIEGLYAGGEVTGSVHGSERVGSCAVSDAMIYGRIAGASAASQK